MIVLTTPTLYKCITWTIIMYYYHNRRYDNEQKCTSKSEK